MCCYKLKSLLLVAALLIHCGLACAAEIVVTDLRCDEKINPVGVAPEALSFSWTWRSDSREDAQKYYQIVVSSELSKLNSGDYDVWDSGRVRSANTILREFGGKNPVPNKKFYWKVRIWNTRNKASAWSDMATFTTSLDGSGDWADARWIGLEQMPESERVVPGIHTQENHAGIRIEKNAQAPYFRKNFPVDKPVKEAYLSISGLGHYQASVNGRRVADSFLAQGWTHYDKQVLFNTYDVSEMLSAGENVLSAIVGNGFHYINHNRYLKLCIAFGYPKLICRLHITYADGTSEDIVTDDSWRVTPSPIVFSSIYGGEDYDARLEKEGFDRAGYDAGAWANALVVAPPAGKLEPETTYSLAVCERFYPRNIYTINDTCYTYDFGQNASGIVEIRVKGKKGDKVRIWPGELLSANKRVNQKASGTPYYFEYTLKGDRVETWQPKFTYYGFRYVTVEGAYPSGMRDEKGPLPQISGLELLHTRNSAPQVGTFACSSELLNRTYRLIDWAIRSNMQSVMTDCPHREKLGWLEQSHLMGNSIRYNYSVYHLYRKKIRDMINAQRDNGLIPDIAPEYVVFSDGFVDSPEWGSAGVVVPWLVYKWYGDQAILGEAYPMMTRYVEYLKSKSDNHILSHGLGDWFDYGPQPPGVAQLTPVSLTATAIYYYDVKLLGQIAAALGKKSDTQIYFQWAEEIKTAFNAAFYDPVQKTYSTGSQTAISMPLCVGLADGLDKEALYGALCKSIENDGYSLTAGDVGFHFLVAALSEKSEYSEVLYKMINRDDVPGYGFQLAKGATALTESWPALEEVSNNHLMLGHIMEWFYTAVLGINDAPDAIASDKIILRPMPVGDLTWAQGAYDSPHGPIKVRWDKRVGEFALTCDIPSGVTAQIVVPEGFDQLAATSSDLSRNIRKQRGNLVVEVTGGQYELIFMSSD